MHSAPIESKVTAASAGAAVSGLILWALAHWVFDGDNPPEVVVFVTTLLVPAVVTFVAGYASPHTPRADPDALGVDPV